MLDTNLINEYKEECEESFLKVFLNYKKALKKVKLAKEQIGNGERGYVDAEFLMDSAEEYAVCAEVAMKELKASLKSLQEVMSTEIRKAKEEISVIIEEEE